jgi:predicted transcriptional regulator
MDLTTRKLQLVKQLMGVASSEQIRQIEDFFQREIALENDPWTKIPESVQKIIDQSLDEVKAGKLVSSDEVMAQIKSKYKIA